MFYILLEHTRLISHSLAFFRLKMLAIFATILFTFVLFVVEYETCYNWIVKLFAIVNFGACFELITTPGDFHNTVTF